MENDLIKKNILVTAMLLLVSHSAMAACDRTASQNVQSMLREMASWSEKNGKVRFEWGSSWDSTDQRQRLGLTTAFANSDACLNGQAREIEFYRKGKLVGKASSSSGISLVN